MLTGFFKCPNGHWADFLPNGEPRCPRCGERWMTEMTETNVIHMVGYFSPHAPVKGCKCSACKINGRIT